MILKGVATVCAGLVGLGMAFSYGRASKDRDVQQAWLAVVLTLVVVWGIWS